jgi:hypothetical protein
MHIQRKGRYAYSKSGGISQGLLGVMQRHNTDTLRSDYAVLPALKLGTCTMKVNVLDLKKCK